MPRPRILRALLIVLALSLAGCSRPAGPAPDPDVESVRMRLGARSFGQPGNLRAVAQIGEEARPVVVAPTQVLAAEAHGVALEGGIARAEVELAPEARGLPDAAYMLSAQVIPKAVADVPAAADGYARARPFTGSVGTFRLRRDAATPERATIEYTPREAVDSPRLNLRLNALLPIATALDGEEFTVPHDAHLEVGYGLAHQPGSTASPRVAFRGVLSCNGRDDVVLVDASLGTSDGDGSAGRWHDVRQPLQADARCRLKLASRSLDGDDVRGAVWSVPQVVVKGLAPSGVPRSVILISLDTLRADHLSGYGYPRATSPAIDAGLIARGTTFVDASTTFPRTDVSHMSLFTALFPGAQATPGILAAASPVGTLAEALRDGGLETVAFTEDALVAGSFGFWFGFDRFVERTFVEQGRGEKTFADARRFVADNAGRRFFAFLHTYKTHDPYVSGADAQKLFTDAPPQLAAKVPERSHAELDAYDRTIVEADQLVAGLLDDLDRLGLAETTLVVLVSDHGEAFGEHGVSRHGLGFQQEQLHVPLVFRGPGIPAGERVEAPVSLVDVAPTVLQLLQLPALPGAQGTSVAAAFSGGDVPAERPLFFSWMGAPDAIGMRAGKQKVIRAGGKMQLFDLGKDPGEMRARALDDAESAALVPQLEAHIATSARHREATAAASAAGNAPIPQQVEDSLRALGYL